MSELTQVEDLELDAVISNFGPNVRAAVVRVKELIDEYAGMDFNTRKASAQDIKKSFDLLHNIYTTALSTNGASSIAAIQYLVRRFAVGRPTHFSALRVNMMPNIEEGGSKAAVRFVADMNQLFGSLIQCSNAEQLRRRMRLDPVLKSIRSESQRTAVLNYISTIDH